MQPKILIVRMDRLGDLLLSTPAIRAVRRALPDAYIAVMVRPYTADVVRDNPDIDEVIVYDKDAREKGAWGNIRFIVRLFLKRFDTALILHSTNRSVLIPFLAGIRRRVGYARRLGFLLSHPMPLLKGKGEKHEAAYSLDVLKKAGIPVGDMSLMPVFCVSGSDRDTVKRLLENKGVKQSDTIVCIHAGASCPSRRWPLARFRDVARYFIRQKGCVAVVIGGAEEAERAAELAGGMGPKLINVAGMLKIGETAALIARSAVLISTDSGPMHLAVAVGTPAVAIFGRKDPGLGPKVWGPLGDHDVVLHKDAGCVTCLAHGCREGFKCLDAVSTQDVLQAADGILSRTL